MSWNLPLQVRCASRRCYNQNRPTPEAAYNGSTLQIFSTRIDFSSLLNFTPDEVGWSVQPEVTLQTDPPLILIPWAKLVTRSDLHPRPQHFEVCGQGCGETPTVVRVDGKYSEQSHLRRCRLPRELPGNVELGGLIPNPVPQGSHFTAHDLYVCVCGTIGLLVSCDVVWPRFVVRCCA